MSIQPYNITLGEESPTFQYSPVRDGPLNQGWNSSYSGSIQWWGNEGAGGIGQAYRRTQFGGAGFSLDFDGTALYLCLTQNGGAGYSLTVDGHAITKTGPASDAACSGFHGAQVLVSADGLTYGSHTAVFNATIPATSDSLDFYGGVVTLSAGPAGTVISGSPTLIDDRNAAWQYEPWTWPQGSSSAEYNGTHSYACNYLSGVTASVSFNGTSVIQLIGTPSSNTFGYSIEFNNVETVYNSTNYWWAARQTLFFAGGLDPTQKYTLTLIDYDANQPNGPPGLNTSGLYCINLDALLLTQVTLPSTASSSSAPSGTDTAGGASQSSGADTGGNTNTGGGGLSGGAIAGIVIGVVAVIALAVIIWFLLRRLKNRLSPPPGGQAIFTHSYRGSTPHPPEPIPFISPVETTTYTSGAPVSLGAGTTASSYRTEKRMPSNNGYTGVPPARGPLSEGGTSSSSDPRMTQDILQNAPTVDLVNILNQRLRREQADNVEEPPLYG